MKYETISVEKRTKRFLEELKRGSESWTQLLERLGRSYLINDNPVLEKYQKESLKRMTLIESGGSE